MATSGGRAVRETYCCVNGTTSASYPSEWYAFDVGQARFYVLSADWADSNVGTGTVYSDDYAAHWAPGTPQYQWLQADLAAHPTGLKFAFFHYPLYSDQKAQTSDTFLQGTGSLEGLLASNHVSLAFNGHAHIYERNVADRSRHVPQLRHRRRWRHAPVRGRGALPRVRRVRHRLVTDEEHGQPLRRRHGPDLGRPRVPLPARHRVGHHRHRDAHRRVRPHLRRGHLHGLVGFDDRIEAEMEARMSADRAALAALARQP